MLFTGFQYQVVELDKIEWTQLNSTNRIMYGDCKSFKLQQKKFSIKIQHLFKIKCKSHMTCMDKNTISFPFYIDKFTCNCKIWLKLKQ